MVSRSTPKGLGAALYAMSWLDPPTKSRWHQLGDTILEETGQSKGRNGQCSYYNFQNDCGTGEKLQGTQRYEKGRVQDA